MKKPAHTMKEKKEQRTGVEKSKLDRIPCYIMQ